MTDKALWCPDCPTGGCLLHDGKPTTEYVSVAQERLSAEASVPLVAIQSICSECGNDDVCEGHLYCSDCLEAGVIA